MPGGIPQELLALSKHGCAFQLLIQIVSRGFITHFIICLSLRHRLLKYKLKQPNVSLETSTHSQTLIQQQIKEGILCHVKQAAGWRVSIRAALFWSTAAAAYSLSQL